MGDIWFLNLSLFLTCNRINQITKQKLLNRCWKIKLRVKLKKKRKKNRNEKKTIRNRHLIYKCWTQYSNDGTLQL